MTAWWFSVGGIRDQYIEMTATDQTHYVFATAHGSFKIKNVTSGPSVPLLVTGGNAKPDTGVVTNILDTSGGTIFCIEDTVVAYNSSNQAVNLATVQAGINSLFTFPVAGYVAADIRYVKGQLVNGAGTSGSPWGP